MLRAIAIYERNETDGTFVRKEAVEKPGTVFSPNKDLSYFESYTLAHLNNDAELLSGEVMFSDKREPVKGFTSFFSYAQDVEFYYAKYVPETKHLLVLISKNELFDAEPRYLLINMDHVDQYPEKVGTTLNDILRNPIGYTGRDIFYRALRQDIAKTKIVALKAKAAAAERGEQLTELNDETDELYARSDTFKLTTHELQKSYTCCGGWVLNPFK